MGGACSTYGGGEGTYWVLVGKPKRKNHWEDPGADGIITLKWNSRKWDGVVNRHYSLQVF
jgi:hypothetical protein